MKKHNRGFSLIELAIVMFIVSIILGGLLTPLSSRLESQYRKQTTTMLAEIRESLIGYAIINGHLPCPDCPDTTTDLCGNGGTIKANDGIEDGIDSSNNGVSPRSSNFSSCATDEGNLPWSTLGVPEYDAWENRYDYRVTDCFARDPDSTNCTTSTSGVSFSLSATGDINIVDENGNQVAKDVPAIVISYGANANDVGNPSSASEKENQDRDKTYVEEDYRGSSSTNEFDDLVTWIAPSTLMYKMISAERLP